MADYYLGQNIASLPLNGCVGTEITLEQILFTFVLLHHVHYLSNNSCYPGLIAWV